MQRKPWPARNIYQAIDAPDFSAQRPDGTDSRMDEGPAMRGPAGATVQLTQLPFCANQASIAGRRSLRIIMRYLMFATVASAARREVAAMWASA